MADYTLSGAYELATPGDAQTTTGAFGAISELRYSANSDLGGDDLTVTAAGHYPNMATQAAVSITATRRFPTARTLSLSGFTVVSAVERYIPNTTEIRAKRLVDLTQATADILAWLDAEPTTSFRLRNYPLLQRWNGILRPTGHVADAPTIWAYIAERVRVGSQPNYARVVKTLAEHGLEILPLASISEAPTGYFSLTAAGAPIAIVPMSYRRLIAQPNDAQGQPRPGLPRVIGMGELAAGGFAIETADRADDTLGRKISFSVPAERALFDDRRTDKTVIAYEGGASLPSVTMQDAFERPHYGAIGLEGERYRRYMTNRTASVTVSEHLAEWRIRDGVRLPTELGGGEWTVTAVDSIWSERRVESSLELRSARNPTAANVYASSPPPFNAASGWPEIHKPPDAPTMNMVDYDPDTGAIIRLPSVGAPLQSRYGAGMVLEASKTATAPEADSTQLLLRERAESESISDAFIITQANIDGTAAIIPYSEGLAEANIPASGALQRTPDTNIYTLSLAYQNEWGVSPPTTVDARMLARQNPSAAIRQIMPKRIQEQMAALPDQLYSDYAELISPILEQTASADIERNPTGSANILLVGILQALNEQTALSDLDISAINVAALYITTSAGIGGSVIALSTVRILSNFYTSISLLAQFGQTPSLAARFGFIIKSFAIGSRFLGAGGTGGVLVVLQNIATALSFGARSAIVIPVVGQAVSFMLSVAQLGILTYQLLNRQNLDGAFINIAADGHGYPVRDALVQKRYRDGVLSAWQDWEDAPVQPDGVSFLGVPLGANPGGGFRVESETNGAGTVKAYLQFDPMSVIPESGRQWQYRVAAVTAVNDKRASESDEAWWNRLDGRDAAGDPIDGAESQWTVSTIIRENDYREHWLRIAPNSEGNDIEITRIGSGLPTYPSA